MAVNQEFFQKLEFDGTEIDIGSLIEGTYIEPIDLSGPLVIFLLRNDLGYVTDELGLKNGSVLTVTVSDIDYEDEVEYPDKFVVTSITPDKQNNTVTVEAMQQDVWKSCERTTLYFSKDSPAVILGKVFPGIPQEVSSFPPIGDYLCSNSRPINMLAQLKEDLGAFCWYSRGKIYLKKFEEVFDSKEVLTAEYDALEPVENSAKISSFRGKSNEEINKAILQKQPVGFDIESGFIESQYYKDKPKTQTQLRSRRSLDRFSLAYYQSVDLAINGKGIAVAGKTIGIHIFQHYVASDRPLDESIPPKVIIGKAIHYSHKQRYTTRIVGYSLLDPLE